MSAAAHEQQRREETLSTHIRHGHRCAACGQTWQCTPYVWATGGRVPRRPAWQRSAIAVVVAVALVAAALWLLYALAGPVVGR